MCALDWYDRVPITNILYNSLQEGWITRKGTEVYAQKFRSSFHTFLQSHSHKGKGSRAREGLFLLQRVKAWLAPDSCFEMPSGFCALSLITTQMSCRD